MTNSNHIVIGIHDIALATTTFSMDMKELADATGVDVNKYRVGIGQDTQSVPADDEDIVTLAAEAARPIIERHGTDHISTVILATETGIDQSKSAGLYVHSLLDLPANVRVIEFKQACYAGTAGLQLAAGLLSLNTEDRVLVIATDIARYDAGTSGESTQGAAAVAMLIVAHDPAIALLNPISGLYSSDIMDFWRPNHRTTARVDGERSIAAYLDATIHAVDNYLHRGGLPLSEMAAFCYHQPFTKMAYKAHKFLLSTHGIEPDNERLRRDLSATTIYNRSIGNSYTASLYVGLLSLLDHSDDMTGKHIAMLSYGSGCVAEFFTLTMQPGYRGRLRSVDTKSMLAARTAITHAQYLALRNKPQTAGQDHEFDLQTAGGFRLAAVEDEKRIYRTTNKYQPATATG